MNTPKKEDLNCSGKLGKAYIKKNYPEFYEYLTTTYINTSTEKFAEKLYLYYNDMSEPPKCPVCGKDRPFLDFLSRGYQSYCSSKCANSDKLVQEKKAKTCMEHYGVEHPAQNKEVKDKIISTYIENNGGMGNASESVKNKQRNTMVEKYGCEYTLQNKELLNKSKQTWIQNHGGVGAGSPKIKEKISDTINQRYGGFGMASDIIREKIISTNNKKYGYDIPTSNKIVYSEWRKLFLEKYGVDSPMKIEEVRQKFKDTMMNRYGVDSPAKLDFVQEKMKNTCLEKYGVENAAQSELIKDKTRKTCLEKYGVEWPSLLPQASAKTISNINIEFAKNISDNGIKCELEYKIINKSFDIKVENTLIEINPYITHNSTWSPFGNPKDINYHFNKTKLGTDNGFRVINVWDWDDQYKIIQSLLPKSSIYARKCIIKEVPKKTAQEFLNLYHFQGNCNGQKVILGLYHNDELIELMSFGKPRYNKKYEWELLRLCTKFKYNIIGGSEKLFKYFINTFKPTSIISYCDNSKFKGDVYNILGFKLKNYGSPTKHWYNIKTKQHITDNLLRQRGFDQLFGTDYGKGTSNEELMLLSGFVEIYDAGQSVWVWNSENNNIN